MILGAGLYQVPVIRQAQHMGFCVIAVSISGDYPGFKVADRSYEIDVREKEEIFEIAKREKISGILTDQTDISIPTVAYVAEQLGLPGIGYDCAMRFTNKFKMRQFCSKIGVPVPRHFTASTMKEAREHAEKLGYPLIAKPVDSQGSRGVSKINHSEELEKKFKEAISYSASKGVILEEFISSGNEVVVEGFVSDFEFTNLVIGDRSYFDIPDTFIPRQTLFPSLLAEDLKQRILEMNEHLIRSFRPKFGITHSEYLIQPETGKVHLVETAIRGGGVFISSDLIPLACGVNVNELLIRCALGFENPKLSESNFQKRSSGYICFHLPEGVIRSIEGADRLISLPGVEKSHLDEIKVGKPVKPMKDKTMRLGPILVAGKDRKEIQETIGKVQKILKIEVETSKGIRGIEW